jgi:PadR family transcriptional regulator, regulatory protein PadR
MSGHLDCLCLVSLGMTSARLKGSLDLMLMGALQRGPAHGYALIAALRERSNGEFDLAEGTIYPALHRLEEAGQVASSIELAQGRRRRTYELTERGRKEFVAQRRDWQEFVTHMQAVLT